MAVTLTLHEFAAEVDTLGVTANTPVGGDGSTPDGDTGGDDDAYKWRRDLAARLYRMGVEQVNRYAPDAPSATCNEALLRFAAAALHSRHGLGEFAKVDGTVFSKPAGPSVFRNSGAMALLAPYRVHRAGVC